MLSLLETLYQTPDINVATINFVRKTGSTTLSNTDVKANYIREIYKEIFGIL